jgi:hypothetical protein
VTKPEDHRVSLSILPGSYNVLRESPRVVACWRLSDGAFGFDNKFVGRGAIADFAKFRVLWKKHPGAKVALFGHADVTGKDAYNHDLGAKRALAVYAVLRRDPDLWCEMYQADPDGLAYAKKRLRKNGHPIPKDEKGLGPGTQLAIRAHVEKLAGELALDPTDFLGEHGQYSMQSCSEFNALRRISKELQESLDFVQRIAFERANRRVLAFLFAPGTFVEGRWPCPRPGEGVDGCKARFWSDGKARRAVGAVARQFVPQGVSGGPVPPVVPADDTFACRFYDRIAHASGCERAEPWIPPPPPPPEEVIIIVDDDPVDPDLDQIVLMCAHPNRYNSGYLGKAGVNRIEVVPEAEEMILASVIPAVNAAWTVPDDSPPPGPVVTVPVAPYEIPEELGFFELMRSEPKVHEVRASHKGKDRRAEIHVYPSQPFDKDLEDELETLAKATNVVLTVWDFVLEIFADDFELQVLDPEKCGLRLTSGWREYPNLESGSPKLDHRSFFGYSLLASFQPALDLDITMEVSIGTVLKKLKKIKWVKKWLEKISDSTVKKLESAAASARMHGKLAGDINVIRDHPDQKIASIGVDDTSEKAEISGDVDYTVTATVDLDELFDKKKGTLGKADVQLEAQAKITIGLLLDHEGERAGLYVEGALEKLEVKGHVPMPDWLPDEITEPFEEFSADLIGHVRTFERREIALPI